MNVRIGQGIDVHKLVPDRPLLLGGINIPSDKGSLGHSDGDVLLHAITDAVLGSMSLGDIGTHFPSEDDQWKNAESKIFLTHANYLILEYGRDIFNIDATIILQRPKIAEYIPKMIVNIATLLNMPIDDVSVKATTTDHLGFIGSGDGIACMATVITGEIGER